MILFVMEENQIITLSIMAIIDALLSSCYYIYH